MNLPSFYSLSYTYRWSYCPTVCMAPTWFWKEPQIQAAISRQRSTVEWSAPVRAKVKHFTVLRSVSMKLARFHAHILKTLDRSIMKTEINQSPRFWTSYQRNRFPSAQREMADRRLRLLPLSKQPPLSSTFIRQKLKSGMLKGGFFPFSLSAFQAQIFWWLYVVSLLKSSCLLYAYYKGMGGWSRGREERGERGWGRETSSSICELPY